MSPHPDFARRAFDAVAGLQAARSLAELDATAGRAFADLGFPHYAAARFFRRDRRPDTAVLFGAFHAGWARRYAQRNYAGSSQIAGRMLECELPYSWNDVLSRADPSAEQLRIWNEARDFGLKDGLFTPLRGADGSYLAVVLSGEAPDLNDPLVRTTAQVVSTFYGLSGQKLLNAQLRERPLLTARQRECLAWVREGKSSAAIGEILGISAETADEHIAAACRRLGVRTRVQAVVEACLSGLLEA